MSEPFLERLIRFTPDAGKVDRDALLFATGRASARPNRGWIVLASMLAGTQALSLLLLWPHATLPVADFPGSFARVSAPATGLEARSSEALANSDLWSVRHDLPESGSPEDRPATGVNFFDSGPPLRAFAFQDSSILN
jgi:hypothetical protein